MKVPFSFYIIPFVLVAILVGINGGWQRMGWDTASFKAAGDHGALMTGSFLGTLICLERCILQKNKWWRILPALAASSMLLLLAGEILIAYLALIMASAGLMVLLIKFFCQRPNVSNLLLFMGAFAWLTGNLILINHHSYPAASRWWMLFLLWTIFGERLELSSMLPVSKIKSISMMIIVVMNLVGVLLPFHIMGNEFFGWSLAALAMWLFLFDMTRFAVKMPGQHRYSAILLMTGYAWLIITATWLVFLPGHIFSYDASLHSFFLGFVISMIFAHVPIIFPGIFRLNISLYHPLLYVVFIAFQLSILSRVIGDYLLDVNLRKWGALFNGIMLLIFLLTTAIIILVRVNERKRYVTA